MLKSCVQAGLGIIHLALKYCSIFSSLFRKIWECGLLFAPPLPRASDHFLRAGRETPLPRKAGQGGELPLKFEEIVDMYYDKMRPPKAEG